MKIFFVGEALSGFAGTETVIRKLTHFIQYDPLEQNDYMLYFLCRNDRMNKDWLTDKNCNFLYAKAKISFIRRWQYVGALTKYIK